MVWRRRIPNLVRAGIRLRQFGQEIIEALGGKKIHPAWVAPGGVRGPLTEERRQHIRGRIPEVWATAVKALELFKGILDKFQEEVETFGNFPSLFMGLVTADGTWEHYGDLIRIVDSQGQIVADKLDPARYQEYIGEAVESWSYLKSPYYKPLGYPNGMYRVGPLARLNLCQRMGTPAADKELIEFRQRGKGTSNSSFYYHYARLIEIVTALERIEQVLDDPDILSDHLKAKAGINRREGVGVSEAPRGTLFHHYVVDEHGLIERVNLIIATGHNNLAINQTVTQIARHYVHGSKVSEGILNRVEAGIRAFDPCLSCSTHAVGQMPLHIQLIGPDGKVVSELRRSENC